MKKIFVMKKAINGEAIMKSNGICRNIMKMTIVNTMKKM